MPLALAAILLANLAGCSGWQGGKVDVPRSSPVARSPGDGADLAPAGSPQRRYYYDR